jgi:hypothetical protein
VHERHDSCDSRRNARRAEDPQRKTPNRTLRFGDVEWEGFGVFSEARESDRTKILALFMDACLGRPVELPVPLPRALLGSAAAEAEKALRAETDPDKRKKLADKYKALKDMAAEVAERTGQ